MRDVDVWFAVYLVVLFFGGALIGYLLKAFRWLLYLGFIMFLGWFVVLGIPAIDFSTLKFFSRVIADGFLWVKRELWYWETIPILVGVFLYFMISKKKS